MKLLYLGVCIVSLIWAGLAWRLLTMHPIFGDPRPVPASTAGTTSTAGSVPRLRRLTMTTGTQTVLSVVWVQAGPTALTTGTTVRVGRGIEIKVNWRNPDQSTVTAAGRVLWPEMANSNKFKQSKD